MPPIIAFQSLADATVLTDSLVTRLFDRLTVQNSELVLYDTNRYPTVRELVRPRFERLLERILASPRRGYSLTVLTNEGLDSREVEARTYLPGGAEVEGQATGLSWPDSVYSMSHVAIPFPLDDPIYGLRTNPDDFSLGDISPRGERGALAVSVTQFTRLRHNPFYPHMNDRILDFLRPLEPSPAAP